VKPDQELLLAGRAGWLA